MYWSGCRWEIVCLCAFLLPFLMKTAQCTPTLLFGPWWSRFAGCNNWKLLSLVFGCQNGWYASCSQFTSNNSESCPKIPQKRMSLRCHCMLQLKNLKLCIALSFTLKLFIYSHSPLHPIPSISSVFVFLTLCWMTPSEMNAAGAEQDMRSAP